MGNSLQDELLKAGLVDKGQIQQANKAKKNKQRAANKKKDRRAAAQDPELQRQRAEKAARDQELNRQRDEVRRQREVNAQVRQLVSQHRIAREAREDDVPFHFENKGKVKRMYVSVDLQRQIAAGRLCIVNDNGQFELVPPKIAERIRQRNPSLVIDLPETQEPEGDDPYAAFKVPDDLMW